MPAGAAGGAILGVVGRSLMINEDSQPDGDDNGGAPDAEDSGEETYEA
jgi:hypothetical protein